MKDDVVALLAGYMVHLKRKTYVIFPSCQLIFFFSVSKAELLPLLISLCEATCLIPH